MPTYYQIARYPLLKYKNNDFFSIHIKYLSGTSEAIYFIDAIQSILNTRSNYIRPFDTLENILSLCCTKFWWEISAMRNIQDKSTVIGLIRVFCAARRERRHRAPVRVEYA